MKAQVGPRAARVAAFADGGVPRVTGAARLERFRHAALQSRLGEGPVCFASLRVFVFAQL